MPRLVVHPPAPVSYVRPRGRISSVAAIVIVVIFVVLAIVGSVLGAIFGRHRTYSDVVVYDTYDPYYVYDPVVVYDDYYYDPYYYDYVIYYNAKPSIAADSVAVHSNKQVVESGSDSSSNTFHHDVSHISQDSQGHAIIVDAPLLDDSERDSLNPMQTNEQEMEEARQEIEEFRENAVDTIKDSAHKVKEGVVDGAHKVKEGVEDGAHKVKEGLSGLADRVHDDVQSAIASTNSWVDDKRFPNYRQQHRMSFIAFIVTGSVLLFSMIVVVTYCLILMCVEQKNKRKGYINLDDHSDLFI